MSPKPTIVIVPGAWQFTSVFVPFADLLRGQGFTTEIVDMPSVGGTELPLTGLDEDIKAVRDVVQPLVEAGKEVVLLTHSAGGVSGSGAVKGLDVKARKEAGLAGGVVRVIFMAAFMVPKGSSLLEMLGGKPAPWMIVEVSSRLARVRSGSFGVLWKRPRILLLSRGVSILTNPFRATA